MKKYYWSIEEQRIITFEELEEYHKKYYPLDSTEKFLSDCSYLNNGDIEPLDNEIKRTKKQMCLLEKEQEEIRSCLYDSMYKPLSETDEKYLLEINEEIEELKQVITDLSALAAETI